MPPPRTPAEGAPQVLSRQPSAGDPSPDEELPHVAFAALARALPLSPDDASLHAATLEAAERADALESYVEVVSDLLGHFPARTRAFLHRILADVHEQKLRDREAAIRHFRAAVDAAPEDLEALASLRRLHVASAEWAALADVLERIADAAPDPSKKLTSWREAAIVHEQMLRDDESAAKCWRRIAEQQPNDRDAAHALERLYVAQDLPEGLCFALELGRAQEGDSARGHDLTVSLAVLKAQRFGALAEAVTLCREVLGADPTHPGALEALQSWASDPTAEGFAALKALDHALCSSGDPARRIALREERSLKVGQVERSQLASEMMQIWDEELRQKPQAFMAGLKAFASGVERAALLPTLTRLARETSSLDELAEVVEASAESLPSGHRELPTFLRYAAMIREELAQYDAAKQLWNDLLAEACEDGDALDGLARLYDRAGEARNLSEVFARKAKAARDPEQRQAMLLKAAAAHEAAGDDDEAIDALRAALEFDLNAEALVGLDRILGRRGRFDEQAEVLHKLAGMSSSPELAQILHSRRGYSLEQAGDMAAAARAYAQALSISLDDEAIGGLERLLGSAAAQGEAAGALEPVYRARQDLRKLAAVLEMRIEATPRSRQAPILEELAAIWEAVGELNLAFTARLRSFMSDPEDARHRAELERLAGQTGAIDDLIAAYQDQLDRGVNDALAAELWRTIATLSESAHGHGDLALRAWEEALRRHPGKIELLRPLADACRRAKAVGRLSEVLPQLIAAEPSREAQVDLLFELAQLAEDALANKSLAARSYKQILERMPRESSAFNSLARLLAEGGEDRALAALLEKGIRLAREAAAEQPARPERSEAESRGRPELVEGLEIRLGRLKLDRLGEHEGALAIFQRVLERSPRHPEAVAALEEMAFGEGPCRAEAVKALEPIFEEAGRQLQLVQLLEAKVLSQPTPQERAASLRRIAQIRAGSLGDAEMGFLAAARALREVPGDFQALEICLSLGEAADARDELCSLLEEAEPAFRQTPNHAPLVRAMAKLQEELGQSDRALASWRNLQAGAAQDVEAIAAIDRLLTRTGRLAERCDFLEQLAAASAGPERLSLLQRLAAGQEAAGKPDAAVETLRTAFAVSDDPAPLEALDPLLGRLGRLREQAEVLAKLASCWDSPHARADGDTRPAEEKTAREYLLRRARTLESAGELDAALTAFEQINKRWPDEVGAVEGIERLFHPRATRLRAAALLESIYRGPEHARRRAEVLEVLLEAVEPQRRPSLLRELSALYDSLGEVGPAFAARVRIFAENPEDDELRRELEQAADASGRLEDLIAAYRDQLDRGASERLSLALRHRMAQAYERLNQPALAVQLWEEIVDGDPSDSEPLKALARIYREASNHEHLTRVLLRRAAAEPVQETQLEVWREVAQLAENILGDRPLAIRCYRSILEYLTQDEAALGSLRRLLEATGDHAQLAEVLQRQLELAIESGASDAAVELELRLGQLEAVQLDNATRALERFADVLRRSPGHAGAVGALEAIAFSESPARAGAAHLLESVYRSRDQRRMLVSALEAQLAQANIHRRLELFDEIARTRESLGEPALAFAARLRAFVLRPDETQLRAELDRLARATGLFEALADAYEELLEGRTNDELTLDLSRTLAALREQLGDLPAAASAWERVLACRPGDREVLSTLARLYQQTGARRELAKVMAQQVPLEPSVEIQVEMLLQLAQLADRELSDKQLAAWSCMEALQRRPDEWRAFQLLDPILAETGRYDELSELLAAQILLAEKLGAHEERFELMVRLARLRQSALDDADGALELLHEVLAERPNRPGAIGVLEEMMHPGGRCRARAAALLQPMFERSGEWTKLVLALEAIASGEESPPKKVALLHRIADLHSGPLRAPRDAFEAAARALRETPDDATALKKCVALSDAADLHAPLTHLLEEIAPRVTSPAPRAAIHRMLAPLLEGEGRWASAAESWNCVLHEEPTDAEALERAARLLERQQRWPELLQILEAQLRCAATSQTRCALLYRMGTIRNEALSDPDGALASFRSLLEIAPEDAPALERMDELCQRQALWPELADVLARRIRLHPEASAELKLRLARICAAQLDDLNRAVQLYAATLESAPEHAAALSDLASIVDRDPQNAAACEALSRAYRRTGQVDRLASLIATRAGAAAEPQQRKRLWMELAELRSGEQSAPEMAFAALASALREDPEDAQLRQILERLADRAGAHLELAPLLEEILPRVANPSQAAQVCLALGSLFELKVNDLLRAIEFYQRARQHSAEAAPTALTGLERLLTRLQRWAELGVVLDELEPLAADPQIRVELLFRIGELADRRLDAPERAVRAYESILALEPQNQRALRALEGLYERAEKPEQLFAVLDRLGNLLTGDDRHRARMKMAQIADQGLWDAAGATALCRGVLAENPGNEHAFAMLATLLQRGQRNDELRDLLHARIAVTVEPRGLIDLHHRLAELLYRAMSNPHQAVPHYQEVLERDPGHLASLEALRAIHEQLGRKEDLAQVLAALVPLQGEAVKLREIRIRLAEVLVELGRREESLPPARLALDASVGDAEAAERLRDLFLSVDAYPEAVRSLELAVEAEIQAARPERAVALLFQLASLMPRAGNPRGAAVALEQILNLDPSNRAAYDAACKLYAAEGDWAAYAQLLSAYVARLPADERIAALEKLSEVQEQKLLRKREALSTACEALRMRPEERRWRERVERLAEETGAHQALADVYSALTDSLPRGPLAEEMYRVLARVQDERLDQPDAAEQTLRKILEFDPVNLRALDALEQMLGRRELHDQRVRALQSKLQAVGATAQRKEIFLEIARIFEERLGDSGQAVTSLERALELSTDPRERLDIQLQIADLFERKLEDADSAASGYRHALQLDPASVEAFKALERLYTRMQRPDQVLWLYEQRLAVAQDAEERVRLLFTSADLWETRCYNRLRADACLEAVLQIRPHDLRAIEGLKRIRRAEEKWEALASALQRQIQACADPVDRAQLYLEQGEIFRDKLSDLERAAASWRKALELEPRHRAAIRALASLHEQSGRWANALQMLEREAELETDVRPAAELHHRMARIREERLHDFAGAQQNEQRALDLVPGYLPSLHSLRALYLAEHNWVGYEHTLIEEVEHAPNPEAKHRAAIAVAQHVVERRGDASAATPWYEEALRAYPDSIEAAAPLADVYLAREDWARGEKMLEIVVEQLIKRRTANPSAHAPPELCEQLCRFAGVARRLEKKKKALTAYEEATRLDPGHLGALRGQAEVLFDLGRLEEALESYHRMMAKHRGELSAQEKVDVYFRLAGIEKSLRKPDAAWGYLEHALGIDPNHVPSLRALIAIADRAGQFDSAAAHRQHLAEVLQGEERFQVCVELAMLAREKLSNPRLAVVAYLKALEVKPDACAVLEALYETYRDSAQPHRAADVLDALLRHPEVQANGARSIQLRLALGEIAATRLGDVDRAAAAFSAALETDPLCADALRALESMLRVQKRWRPLEQAYLQLAQRLDGDGHRALRGSIWRALAELRLTQLQDRASALNAYQAAAADLPGDARLQETFADLGIDALGYEDGAMAAYLRALPAMADPAKACSAAARLAARRKNDDAAYLAARMQECFFGQIGPADRKLLERLAARASVRSQPQDTVSDGLWKAHLLHPAVRGPLGELMAVLFHQAGAKYAASLSEYRVNAKKHRIDLSAATEPVLQHLRVVARLLGIEGFELYSPYLAGRESNTGWRPVNLLQLGRGAEEAPDRTVALAICQTHPFSLVAGGRFFDEQPAAELDLIVGSTLALMRPELALAQRLPMERLQAVLQAAVGLSSDAVLFEVPEKELRKERKALEKLLDEAGRAKLERAVRACAKVDARGDLPAFLHGVELTALRTALFVVGDPEPIKRKLLAEIGPGAKMDAHVRELIAFALSGDLAALRAEVGLALAAA